MRSFSPSRRALLSAGMLLPLWALAGCAGGPEVYPDLPVVSESSYRLGHGDRMRVTVYGQNELTGEYVVDGSGNVTLPLIGDVMAQDGTAGDLEVAITDRLKPNFLNDPKVSVQILQYRPFYILGEVKDPGSYPYVDGMVVMNAVALASGFTYRAREDLFYITRDIDPERKRRLVTANSLVLPGDLITVRERYF